MPEIFAKLFYYIGKVNKRHFDSNIMEKLINPLSSYGWWSCYLILEDSKYEIKPKAIVFIVV